MYKYNGEGFDSLSTFKQKFNLVSYAELMKRFNCGANVLQDIIDKINPKTIEVICEPSLRKIKYYYDDDFKNIKPIIKNSFRNDPIPEGYISKSEFCKTLGLKIPTLHNIVYWCNDFNKYSKQIYIKNVLKRFYLVNPETLEFYREKINKYYCPNRKKSLEQINKINNNFVGLALQSEHNKTRNYKHHKIKIDKDTLSYMLDTDSIYYKKLVEIYKYYSSQTVVDVSIMELHHIVPRFYARNGAYYPQLNSMENLIYLPPNIHFLVHFLEYKCALPIYRQEFFSSCCIKITTLDIEKIEERYITEITDFLIKAFYK